MTTMAPPAARTEYCLGPVSQIPVGEGREFAVEDKLIAVFHLRGGRVLASQALCPHREGPLADGLLGGTTIVCPLHGWKFDLTTGEARMGTCGIAVYPVRVSPEGDLYLTLGADAPDPVKGPFEGPSYPVFTKPDIPTPDLRDAEEPSSSPPRPDPHLE